MRSNALWPAATLTLQVGLAHKFQARTGGSFGGIQARYNVLSWISRTYIHALICLIEGSTEANDYQCASMSTTAR